MGFLSKTTVTCEWCGRSFETRTGAKLCESCKDLEWKLSQKMDGYSRFAQQINNDYKGIPLQTLSAIDEHRNAILKKYAPRERITEQELRYAGDNYSSLGEEEAQSILRRAMNSTISNAACAYYSDHFFIPYAQKGTIVDGKDVYAITTEIAQAEVSRSIGAGDLLAAGMATLIGQALGSMVWFLPSSHGNYIDVLKCMVYTNDPYIPVFAIGFILPDGKGRKKKEEKALALAVTMERLKSMCPNLTYDLMSPSELKKLIKKEKTVRSAVPVDVKTMQKRMSLDSLLFDAKKQEEDLPDETRSWLMENGFFTERTLTALLHLDKKKNSQFWSDIMQRMPGSELETEVEPELPMDEASSQETETETEEVSSPEEVPQEPQKTIGVFLAGFGETDDEEAAQQSRSEQGNIPASVSLGTPVDDSQRNTGNLNAGFGTSSVQTAAAPAMRTVSGTWFCPSCGKKNTGNFCGACGRKKP